MEPIPIEDYIFFGTVLRYLQDASVGGSVHDDGGIFFNIIRFFDFLERFDLPVTKRASYKLRKYRDMLEEKDQAHTLAVDEASELRTIMTDIRNTLMAEAGGKIAYIVTDKRIDVNKLLSNTSSLMSPGVYDSLPAIAKYDFTEASMCIAFERPTAAAFHLLRGTESTLREFYCSIVKQKRVKNLLWGPMVEHLRKRSRPPPKELLDHLDNIRVTYRNPTQHPEKIYDIHRVQDLFNLCVDAVTQMSTLI